MPMSDLAREICLSLLTVVYPERCAGCGVRRGEHPWCRRGKVVPGLRIWDTAALCRRCQRRLEDGAGTCVVPAREAGTVPVVGGCWTHEELVELIGAWKYHGLRGLAWPLAGIVTRSFEQVSEILEPVDILVPVPLHSRRQRTRGFNQATVLAHLLAAELEPIPVVLEIARRHRSTAQQARITDSGLRTANVANAFRVRPASGQAVRVGLVDDLVTTGATIRGLTDVLRAHGWEVRWTLAVGVARDLSVGPGDTPRPSGHPG